jgi:16S rRNA (guanine(527)-N(7))-methyltransferase RsmG
VTFRDLLAIEFRPYGSLSSHQLARLDEHYQLLEHWNQKINLTRIKSMEEAVHLHYCESLFLGQALPAGMLRIVDIGSGGGFPGIPAAILRPECQVDLIESHQRKAVFLVEACRGLPNVKVIPQRAENCSSNYDWMIARAVRPTEVLSLSLAPQAALLMSDLDLQGIPVPFTIQKSPWGENRVLASFHVKH